jgi:hypothetical protein
LAITQLDNGSAGKTSPHVVNSPLAVNDPDVQSVRVCRSDPRSRRQQEDQGYHFSYETLAMHTQWIPHPPHRFPFKQPIMSRYSFPGIYTSVEVLGL